MPARSESTRETLSFAKKCLKALALPSTAILFLGLMVAGIAGLHLQDAAEALPEPHPPATVHTFKLEFQPSYRETVRYVGQLEPARQTAISFERGGLVTTVLKDEGDLVIAGEVLARLDIAQLKARRKQLEARIRELRARSKLAKLVLGRQTKLQSNGWSPEQRLDEAEASVAELAAAIEQAEAQLESIDIDIAKSNLTAPFDGVISTRSIDDGAVVDAGTSVLTVLETDNREARIGLPPHVAVGLDAKQTYRIETSRGEVKGRLKAKRPDLQASTRTVTALFNVSDETDVPFGEIVTLVLEREIKERGAWVPLVALKESDRGLWSLLTVIEQKGIPFVRREAAEVLYVDGPRAYVRGTFESGASVISTGTNRIVPGQRVAVAGR